MTAKPLYKLRDMTLYFLKLSTRGFGGPVALIGHMHTDLVENKGWIAEEEYKEGLAFVLPSFIMVVLLGMAYKLYSGLCSERFFPQRQIFIMIPEI